MTILGYFFAQPYGMFLFFIFKIILKSFKNNIRFSIASGTVKEIQFSEFLQMFLSRSTIFADTMFFFGGFFSMYAWYAFDRNHNFLQTLYN
jgi:hypothetical protein